MTTTTTTTPYIPLADIATELHRSRSTVRKWVHSGKLRAVKIGGGIYSTREWLNEFAQPACVEADVSDGKRAVEEWRRSWGSKRDRKTTTRTAARNTVATTTHQDRSGSGLDRHGRAARTR